jgi:putative acetyltransferase
MILQIRPEQPAEYALVEALHRLAFGGPREANVVARVRQSAHYRPEFSLVAFEGAWLVGHILLSRVGIEDEQGIVRLTMLLAPLAVDPALQRHGVGRTLVAAGLERLEDSFEPLVIVRGQAEYYARFGFLPAEDLAIHPPFALQPGEYMAKALNHYRAEWRGTVRYPAAFAAVGYPTEFA